MHRKSSPALGFVCLASVLLLAVLVAAAFTSCPNPVDAELVRTVEDVQAPVLTITSPAENSPYASTVVFTGTVADDSTASGDGLGSVYSISYDLSNDDFRKGKITIGTDGTVTQDTAFGDGEIVWDAATRTFTFEFSTIEPSLIGDAMLTVTVEVTDRNENTAEKIVRLVESSGPQITLVEPGTTILNYREGVTTVTVTGTVGNSEDDPDSAADIGSLKWGVALRTWGATLDLTDGGAGDLASGVASDGLFLTRNTGFLVNEDFTFDRNTRTFFTTFEVPWGAGASIPVVITAKDLNQHEMSVTYTLVTAVNNPVISSLTPSLSTTNYYSSTHWTAQTVSGTVMEPASINRLIYQVDGTGLSYTSSNLVTSNFFNASGGFSFPLSGAGASLSGRSGPFKVTVTVVNTDDLSTKAYFWLSEDSDNPVISSVDVASSNVAAGFARLGDVLTFTVHGRGRPLRGGRIADGGHRPGRFPGGRGDLPGKQPVRGDLYPPGGGSLRPGRAVHHHRHG